jgi:hypothetical protein
MRKLFMFFAVIALIFLAIPLIAAAPNPGHSAAAIGSGTFDAGDYVFQNNLSVSGNITANYFIGNGSLLTGISGGNLSFNQSLTDKLYAGIQWAYNMTTPFTNWLSTFLYNYNQTAPANSYTDSVISANNASWSSTYNVTYDAKNTSQWVTSGTNISYSSGNVGIGTSTPTQTLNVVGDANITGTIYAHNFTGNSDITFINSTGVVIALFKESGEKNFGEGNLAFTGNANIKGVAANISFVNLTINGTGGLSSSIVVQTPKGINLDDVMIMQVLANKVNTCPSIIVPSRWILLHSGSVQEQMYHYNLNATTYYKIATANEPSSYTISVSPDADISVAILAYRNVDTLNPIESHAINVTDKGLGTSFNTPTINLVHSDDMLVVLFGTGSWDSTFTTPSGMTERYDPDGKKVGMQGSDQLLTSGGSYSKSSTCSNVAAASEEAIIALKRNNALSVDGDAGISGTVYANKMGIGTSTPANTLNVIGDLNVTGMSYLGNIIISADNITVNNLIPKNNGVVKVPGNLNVSGTIYAHNFTGNSDITFINSTGGVIATVKESGGLNVTGDIAFSGTVSNNNLPRARVFRSTTQTDMTQNTYNFVLFDSEKYDNTNNYDTTTKNFTVPITGMYRISSAVTLNSVLSNPTTSDNYYISIFVNGVHTVGNLKYLTARAFETMSIDAVLNLNAGDKVQIAIYPEDVGANTVDIYGNVGGDYTYLDIEYLNGAQLSYIGQNLTVADTLSVTKREGIGTSNPQEALNVNGNIRIDSGNKLELRRDTNTYNWRIYADAGNYLQIQPYTSAGVNYTAGLTILDTGEMISHGSIYASSEIIPSTANGGVWTSSQDFGAHTMQEAVVELRLVGDSADSTMYRVLMGNGYYTPYTTLTVTNAFVSLNHVTGAFSFTSSASSHKLKITGTSTSNWAGTVYWRTLY